MQWLGRDDVPPAKCLFTFGLLPRHIDATQPPTKRKPFSSIRGQQWSHAAHALVPAESLVAVRQELARLRTATAAGEVRYAKVIMALGDVLAGDFFNVYVKQGRCRRPAPSCFLWCDWGWAVLRSWRRQCDDAIRGSAWRRSYILATRGYVLCVLMMDYRGLLPPDLA